MPSGVVPHYQLCLLVWCLTLGHSFWCGATSSTMSVGVVPHYRSCLLALYLIIDHDCRPIATEAYILLAECRWKKDGNKSGATEVPLLLSDMPASTVQHYQTCMLGSFIQIHVFVKCCTIRQDIWSVTNPSYIPIGRVPFHRFVKLVGYHPERHLEYIKSE